MRYVLDDERLNGPLTAMVSIRPARTARLVPHGDMEHLMAAIELNCQIWGGGGSPLIPLDNTNRIHPLYRDIIKGADIDRIEAIGLRDFDPAAALPKSYPTTRWGEQLAVSFLEPGGKDAIVPLTVPILRSSDPWRPLYAAALGTLPEAPDGELLSENYVRPDITFEEFIEVNRIDVTGSADDLIGRAESRDSLYPRSLSLAHLASGPGENTSIRTGTTPGALPGDRYEAWDAGPNIVVVCESGNINDAALLWNLRAAHGPRYAVPLGILVEEFDSSVVERLLRSAAVSHQGISNKSLYITSTSVPLDQIENLMSDLGRRRDKVTVVASNVLCDLGPAPARRRTEVSVWSEGVSTVVPISPEDRSALPLHGRTWSDLHLNLKIQVIDNPFPSAPDVRARTYNEEFVAGGMVKSAGRGAEAVEVVWLSRLQMLKVVCGARDLEVSPSEPGLACMTFLDSLPDGIDDLSYLAHAPLLDLLDRMAQRSGTPWAKAHLRRMRRASDAAPDAEDVDAIAAADVSAADVTEVAPTEDDLGEFGFNAIRDAVGSTKAATAWLDWAERRRVIVKGFPVQCENCAAKQWVPVIGFVSPLTCRGCTRTIERPFPGNSVAFRYRIGESLRRVYEAEAMGHLLLMRLFVHRFGRSGSRALVGAHPGLDIRRRGSTQVLGEADTLALMLDGSCVPCEVKRSFGGAHESQVEKLDLLVAELGSPWSALVVPQWGKDAPETFRNMSVREGAAPHRVLLTLDHLLDTRPERISDLGPFAWKPLTESEIDAHNANFTARMASIHDRGVVDWFEDALFYRPEAKKSK